MKHNKKRNTAFIYETLTRELTKAIVAKDPVGKKKVFSIIKEYFTGSSILTHELKLYRILLDTKSVQPRIAERLLKETKSAHALLNRKEIFDAQSQIIADINKKLGQAAWSNFVPNFKSLASVDAIFNLKSPVKRRVLFEQAVIDDMSTEPGERPDQNLDPLDNLTYSSFIKKFNNKYDNLLEEQKELLNQFITSFADNGLELRVYLNGELGRLKSIIKETQEKEENPMITEKLARVSDYLESLCRRHDNDSDIHKLLTTQQLVRELAANA